MLMINNERIEQRKILKRNGRDGTKKYGRKDDSGRRRKIDEDSSRK